MRINSFVYEMQCTKEETRLLKFYFYFLDKRNNKKNPSLFLSLLEIIYRFFLTTVCIVMLPTRKKTLKKKVPVYINLYREAFRVMWGGPCEHLHPSCSGSAVWTDWVFRGSSQNPDWEDWAGELPTLRIFSLPPPTSLFKTIKSL